MSLDGSCCIFAMDYIAQLNTAVEAVRAAPQQAQQAALAVAALLLLIIAFKVLFAPKIPTINVDLFEGIYCNFHPPCPPARPPAALPP